MYIWKHFKTITKHKILVMQYCFRIGLYRQGLCHDLSKYSWTEFVWAAVTTRETEALTMRSGKRWECPPPGCITKEETSIIMNIGSITEETVRRS